MNTDPTLPPWEEAATHIVAARWPLTDVTAVAELVRTACESHSAQVTRERDEARAALAELKADHLIYYNSIADLEKENTGLRAQAERMQHIIVTAIQFIKGTPANHQERLGLIVLAEKLGDAVTTLPPAMGKSQQ